MCARFSRTKPSPFGASMSFINKRDDEDRFERIESLEQAIESLKRENARLQSLIDSLTPAAKPKRKRTAEHHRSPDIINVNGKKLVSVAHIAMLTRLDQSNVSRKLANAGVAPDEVRGNKYYYNLAKLPDIKKKRKR